MIEGGWQLLNLLMIQDGVCSEEVQRKEPASSEEEWMVYFLKYMSGFTCSY